MKRLLFVLITCLLAVAFASATPQQSRREARLVQVKARRHHAARHHAHRATRHRAPKHHHGTV